MSVLAVCLAGFLAAVILTASWRWLALRHIRRRAQQVLRWLEFALGPEGQPTGMRWMERSRFKVPLRLRCGVFHRAWVTIDFSPCDLPLRWVLSRIRGRRDLLTFYADLDLPPSFSLKVHNFRWLARTRGKTSRKNPALDFQDCGRFVITTRTDWQREIPAAMISLARSSDQSFIEIGFQRRSPHFSATLPLSAIAPGSPVRDGMFETMREVAASASTSLS